jgi:hypothetical protein
LIEIYIHYFSFFNRSSINQVFRCWPFVLRQRFAPGSNNMQDLWQNDRFYSQNFYFPPVSINPPLF